MVGCCFIITLKSKSNKVLKKDGGLPRCEGVRDGDTGDGTGAGGWVTRRVVLWLQAPVARRQS